VSRAAATQSWVGLNPGHRGCYWNFNERRRVVRKQRELYRELAVRRASVSGIPQVTATIDRHVPDTRASHRRDRRLRRHPSTPTVSIGMFDEACSATRALFSGPTRAQPGPASAPSTLRNRTASLRLCSAASRRAALCGDRGRRPQSRPVGNRRSGPCWGRDVARPASRRRSGRLSWRS
jgi:hypothetical protein